MKLKKALAIMLAGAMMLSAAGCGKGGEKTTEAQTGDSSSKKVYNVVNLVNGNLGDKSFFDSAQAGLEELEKAGRITLKTIEMGPTDADKPKWEQTLNEVSESGEYDVVVCGTYQMNEYLEKTAAANPDCRYIIYDSAINAPNVCNINYKQNELGYIIGAMAGAMTKEQGIDKINPENVVGFVGGIDIPVINDFLYGFLLGAQKTNPDIKVDTRYIGNFFDTAASKEFALSMINDKKCDIIWGVAGNAGNGAAEAALETGKAWFVGVDSDQELTFGAELAANTITSGLKNVGTSLIWFFDELDAGREHYGENVLLGLQENGIGIVTDKNYDKILPTAVKDEIAGIQKDIAEGKIEVPTAIGDTSKGLEELRDSLQP